MQKGKRKAVDCESCEICSSSNNDPELNGCIHTSQHASQSSATLPSTSKLSPIPGIQSQPKQKKARKAKDPDAPTEEKRAARFKPFCPQSIRERVDRVLAQRFFLIDRKREADEHREEFSVLGSTGNVYTVVIDKIPSCNCPDAQQGNHCKHILFVYLKVLHVSQCSPHWYQKALLSKELEEIFRDAPAAPNAMASASVREAYAQATGRSLFQGSSKDTTKDTGKKRVFGKDDDCAICYDTLDGVSEKQLSYCSQCGNALHKQCFNQWSKSSHVRPLTCVYCRAVWAGETSGQPGAKSRTTGRYVNLADAAGLSPIRDTSSYYQGPRRGQRRGDYQDYNDDDDDYFE